MKPTRPKFTRRERQLLKQLAAADAQLRALLDLYRDEQARNAELQHELQRTTEFSALACDAWRHRRGQ